MPGKVNPSQCEALTMVALHAFGCDATVAAANAQGPLQLNVYKPIILHGVLQPARLMRDACASFTRYAIQGLEPNRPRIEAHLRASLMLGTALVPHIGYDRAAAIALAAQRDGRTLRDAALTSGWVSGADFDAWVDPTGMARPHAAVPE
jgi:fumarate hydratase class II